MTSTPAPGRALVLAAGLGSRLRAIAGDLPKPLMPFGGAPVLAHNLRWLAGSGVGEVWINLHYAAEAITAQIGDGSAFGLTIHYVFEPELLGTAGALANIAGAVTGPIWVVYGDSLVRIDLAAMAAAHARTGAELTLALFDRDRHAHTGVAGGRVMAGADGRVSAFVEGADTALSTLVNAGVYRVEPQVLDLIPRGRAVDFGHDVFPAMLASHRKLFAHTIEPEGYCLGLDTPESFAIGEQLLADRLVVLA